VGWGSAGGCGSGSVARVSASTSTKVKEESVDVVEHLLLCSTVSKVDVVDSDIDVVEAWEKGDSEDSTGLETIFSSVILSGFVEESPFVDPTA